MVEVIIWKWSRGHMEVESIFDWTACEPLGMGNRVVSVNVFVGNDKNLYSIAILIQNICMNMMIWEEHFKGTKLKRESNRFH